MFDSRSNRRAGAAGRVTARWAVLAGFATFATLATPAVARAQFDPITDRDYAIDLYQGSVLGSVRIVGMGGAAAAIAEGSAGMVVNPAAPAVRPATSNDRWDWDFHIDWLNPDLGSDFDNNGIDTADETNVFPLLTGGLVGRYKRWAVGVAVTNSQQPIALDGSADVVTPVFQVGRLVVARTFADDRYTAGLGLRFGLFQMNLAPAGGRAQTLFEIGGGSLEGGFVWRPRSLDLRVGAALAFPVTGVEPSVDACDPNDCFGYILPERVEVPWQASAGVAWRFAGSRWNRQVTTRWRDERYVLVAADVVVYGGVPDGHGVEAFFARQLQPSGRDTSVGARVGAEYEWLPGRLRLRGGSYWEPGRFEGVGGRLHGTFGLEVRVWSFCFWERRYRVRAAMTADVASKYGNTGVSIGFWH